MKCFFIWLSVISTLLPLATAYGSRGAVERLVYYYAYLADELVNADGARTVAVGCRGTLPGNRCNLDEFLKYIWSPLPGESPTPPNPMDLGYKKKTNFEDITVKSLYNKIVKWRDPVDKRGITGNIDNTKLLPGSTDFYDCLARIARPIGMLGMTTFPDDKTKRDLAKKIVDKGKMAAQTLYEFRLNDFDKHRISHLKDKLGEDNIIQKPGRDVVGLMPNWQTLDVDATAAKLGKGGRDTLDTAIMNYYMIEKARDHRAALVAADHAQQLSGCPLGAT
ncbi:uncharacterized protein GIQ15_05807 [Arthroderma uncinatum]|uniref:uncharacterized protein n=1 Tax=Arthroderma uncinatum TaxID=74035 RepID=UPI00144A782C|nr:uncharacterized protein GIQ15_05807 [Arthroderma uncinatum]KAF3480460.1 hypothetical protein GIQ15_05807 [Arthroderma uncinatum]